MITVTIGGSILGVARGLTNSLQLTQSYLAGQTITGCLVFSNKKFSDLGIVDGITSTVSWNTNGAGGLQSIVFKTNRMAASKVCFPSAPVATPIAAPVADPVATPVKAPVAPEAAPPVTLPAEPPVLDFVTPPVVSPEVAPAEPPVLDFVSALLASVFSFILEVFDFILEFLSIFLGSGGDNGKPGPDPDPKGSKGSKSSDRDSERDRMWF